MRVLAIADVHGSYAIHRRLPGLAQERHVQAVVLAGDLLGAPPGHATIEDSQRADARAILEILRPLSLPLLYIMGNDDMVPLAGAPANFQSIHGRRVDLHGFNFVGYQYSLPFMGGVNEKPEEEVAADMAALERLMDALTVLVTHAPAAGILGGSMRDPSGGDPWALAGVHLSPGSPSIRAAVERHSVRAHIHGHIHSCFGREGRHFNVASGPRRLRAMVVDLDTLQHEVIVEEAAGSDRGAAGGAGHSASPR